MLIDQINQEKNQTFILNSSRDINIFYLYFYSLIERTTDKMFLE